MHKNIFNMVPCLGRTYCNGPILSSWHPLGVRDIVLWWSICLACIKPWDFPQDYKGKTLQKIISYKIGKHFPHHDWLCQGLVQWVPSIALWWEWNIGENSWTTGQVGKGPTGLRWCQKPFTKQGAWGRTQDTIEKALGWVPAFVKSERVLQKRLPQNHCRKKPSTYGLLLGTHPPA